MHRTLLVVLLFALAACESPLRTADFGQSTGVVFGTLSTSSPRDFALLQVGEPFDCDDRQPTLGPTGSRAPVEAGGFRLGMVAFAIGSSTFCFDLAVQEVGGSADTLRGLGPVTTYSEMAPLDSLFLRIGYVDGEATLLESSPRPLGDAF